MTDLEMTDGETLYFRDSNFNPADKCPQCEETWLECLRDNKYRLEDAHFSTKLEEMVCFYCYESDQSHHEGTVIIFEPTPGFITRWTVYSLEDWKQSAKYDYFDEMPEFDELEWDYPDIEESCPIQFSYVKSSAWRGRYEAKADGWVSLHEDGILSGSSNADKLKTFSDLVLRLLWGADIEFALIIGTTSNLFYQTYEIKTNGEIPADIRGIMRALKVMYRDPEEYSLTALTGKSGDYTEMDRKFVAYAERILKGESFELIMAEIQGIDQ